MVRPTIAFLSVDDESQDIERRELSTGASKFQLAPRGSPPRAPLVSLDELIRYVIPVICHDGYTQLCIWLRVAYGCSAPPEMHGSKVISDSCTVSTTKR